jgi:ubiquinone/menaquinone biosynthesis C-methylase UbiE
MLFINKKNFRNSSTKILNFLLEWVHVNTKERGIYSLSRNLNQFNNKFSKNILENEIRNKIKKNKIIRVLEIGCGEGRILMELKKLFPKIKLYGINEKKWPLMKGLKSLKKTALYYKIFKKNELKNINLPIIHFYNAEKLKFQDNFFDVIYSQVSFQYIRRKDLLLEEIWRVLKLGGKAYLHIDTLKKEIPDFLNSETPRFLIYKNNKLISFETFLNNLNVDIKYFSKKVNQYQRISIIIHKNHIKKLNLIN